MNGQRQSFEECVVRTLHILSVKLCHLKGVAYTLSLHNLGIWYVTCQLPRTLAENFDHIGETFLGSPEKSISKFVIPCPAIKRCFRKSGYTRPINCRCYNTLLQPIVNSFLNLQHWRVQRRKRRKMMEQCCIFWRRNMYSIRHKYCISSSNPPDEYIEWKGYRS